jgi:[acyl-carrier-protein] S-malonyltransferase
MDVLIVFPGQGSQKVGMAADLGAVFPEAQQVLDGIDAALHPPLTPVMREGPADELTLTVNAQPALLAHSAAVWAVIGRQLRPFVRAAAGHSLGEFSAYQALGAMSAPDAARLVRRRGELMHHAGAARAGGMAAVLGQLSQPIEALCAQASVDGIVVPANFNTDEQVVISGDVVALERAMELARGAGAKRVLRLPVSGAFHSPLMASAVDGLVDVLGSTPWEETAVPVYSNVDARPRRGAAEARAALQEQLTASVRWTAVVRAMAADFPSALWVEVGTGSTLCGMIKRIVPGAETMSCGTVAEIQTLLERVR